MASAISLVEPILLAYVTRTWDFAIGHPLSCARTPLSQGLLHKRREGRRSLLLRPNGAAGWQSERRYIAPCRAAVEEYDLCQGSRPFDCSSLCCARYLTLGALASTLGVCPRHLPTRFTLTRAVQHAQKHFAPPLRALGRTQELAPRAQPRRLRLYPLPAASRSRRSPNPWKSHICSICRLTHLTGSSETRPGASASRPR